MRPDFDMQNALVARNIITFEGKDYMVSTVYLGIDHSFGEGSPLYYETMIFPAGTYNDTYQKRYTDRETAYESHNRLINDINTGKYEIVDGYFERKENGE